MQTRDIVGLTLIPVAFLITAGTMQLAMVGSIVWFCGLIASAVLILALISFCCNYPPGNVPFRILLQVYVCSVIVVGIGVVIRISCHEELAVQRPAPINFGDRQASIQPNWPFLILTGIYEWLSFSLILACVFFAVPVPGKQTRISGAINNSPDQEGLSES